ncbi:MAG TPA: hypothetical protein DCY32_05075 [Opitutae bacterium]|nr:hypothetical protein [Opitutae bacterium]
MNEKRVFSIPPISQNGKKPSGSKNQTVDMPIQEFPFELWTKSISLEFGSLSKFLQDKLLIE